jgi:hypothetical protein
MAATGCPGNSQCPPENAQVAFQRRFAAKKDIRIGCNLPPIILLIGDLQNHGGQNHETVTIFLPIIFLPSS